MKRTFSRSGKRQDDQLIILCPATIGCVQRPVWRQVGEWDLYCLPVGWSLGSILTGLRWKPGRPSPVSDQCTLEDQRAHLALGPSSRQDALPLETAHAQPRAGSQHKHRDMQGSSVIHARASAGFSEWAPASPSSCAQAILTQNPCSSMGTSWPASQAARALCCARRRPVIRQAARRAWLQAGPGVAKPPTRRCPTQPGLGRTEFHFRPTALTFTAKSFQAGTQASALLPILLRIAWRQAAEFRR